jgi:hypothetical protein
VNDEGALEFDVANIHPNALSSVSVQLEAEGIVFSPSEYFIGSMDSDELFTIEINAKAESNDVSFPLNLTIYADYRNGLNEHTEQISVRQLQHDVVEDEGGAGVYVVLLFVIIVGAGAYVLYKRRTEKE